jgi:hypothetical protein
MQPIIGSGNPKNGHPLVGRILPWCNDPRINWCQIKQGEVAQESVSMPISKNPKMVTLPWLPMFKSACVADQEFSWLSFMAAVVSVSMS